MILRVMSATVIIILILTAFIDSACADESMADGSIVRLGESVSLDSKVLGEKRSLSVHLPEKYESGSTKYPVVYMMGSEYRTRFALWAATLDYMGGGEIPPMILVGIDLPEGNGVLVPRMHPMDTMGANKYLKYLTDEVIPFVEKRYRTVPYRVLFGASNSGYFTVYTLLAHPDKFDAYLASSPMLGWGSGLLEKKLTSMIKRKPKSERFLYMIYSDDDSERVTDSITRFNSVLEKDRPKWLRTETVELINQGHVPAVDIPSSLKALFHDFNPVAELDSIEKMQTHYKKLTERYGFEIPVPSSRLFDLGINTVIQKKLKLAQSVFEYSMKIYPDDSQSYLGMGLVRRDQGKKEEARSLLQKALEIEPEDTFTQRLLDSL